MKVKFIRIMLVVVTISIISIIFVIRLKNNKNIGEQIINVPEMILEYGIGHFEIDGNFQASEIIGSGTSNWYYYEGKQIIAAVSCSLHPLDNQNNFVKIDGRDKIRISFIHSPSYYTIRYWPEHYIGEVSKYEEYFETLEINDDIMEMDKIYQNNKYFLKPNDILGYIFEIKAVWESINGTEKNGEAYYNFILMY